MATNKRKRNRVAINVRIRRIDGKPLNMAMTEAVIQRIVDTHEIPPGIEIAAINWQSPALMKAGRWMRRTSGGSADDAWENLKYAVIAELEGKRYRVGAVGEE